jgi:hypothetical protein
VFQNLHKLPYFISRDRDRERGSARASYCSVYCPSFNRYSKCPQGQTMEKVAQSTMSTSSSALTLAQREFWSPKTSFLMTNSSDLLTDTLALLGLVREPRTIFKLFTLGLAKPIPKFPARFNIKRMGPRPGDFVHLRTILLHFNGLNFYYWTTRT